MRYSGATLKFYYGAMGCGKTRKLQGDYYSKKEDGFEVIVIKPTISFLTRSATKIDDINANGAITISDNKILDLKYFL